MCCNSTYLAHLQQNNFLGLVCGRETVPGRRPRPKAALWKGLDELEVLHRSHVGAALEVHQTGGQGVVSAPN